MRRFRVVFNTEGKNNDEKIAAFAWSAGYVHSVHRERQVLYRLLYQPRHSRHRTTAGG